MRRSEMTCDHGEGEEGDRDESHPRVQNGCYRLCAGLLHHHLLIFSFLLMCCERVATRYLGWAEKLVPGGRKR